jgi:type IV secretory pathway VirB10-like protein
VAWTRIILLDSSSIDLGRMPAPIRAGSPALHDQVSTHFWEMISSTLMLSVISAGVQISQGRQYRLIRWAERAAVDGGLGQRLGQLGQELARRNARIPPTLEIRPDYRSTVSVTKDMVLRPRIP